MLKIGSEKPKGTEIANRTRLSVKSAVRKIDSIEQYENFLQRNSRKPCRNAEFKSYAHFLQPFIKLAKKYKINTYIKNKAGKQEKRGTEKQLFGKHLRGNVRRGRKRQFANCEPQLQNSSLQAESKPRANCKPANLAKAAGKLQTICKQTADKPRTNCNQTEKGKGRKWDTRQIRALPTRLIT